MPKEITIIFYNELNYDYHFNIKKLAEEFERQFTCLGENTEKFITFSVPMEQEKLKELVKMEKLTKPYLANQN